MGITTAAAKLPPLKPGEFRFVTNGLSIEMQPAGEDAKGRRRFKAIASSTAKDMRGDEMQMSAMEDMVAAFKRGLNVFMDHNHTAENVFGRTDDAVIRDSGERDPRNGATIWDLHVGGTVNEPNKKAMELADSIDGGYVSFGTSIGAFVTKARKKQDGRDIEHVDCKELSIVGIPMQQRAWTYKSADANWTVKAADAAATLEQSNALFDNDAETAAAVETFSMDPEAVPEPVEAPEPVLEAQEAIDEAPADAEPVLNALDTKPRVMAALNLIADPANDQSRRDEVLAAARAANVGDAVAKGLTDDEMLVLALTDPEVRKAASEVCGVCGGDRGSTGCPSDFHRGDPDHDGDSAASDPDMDGKAIDPAALELKTDTTTGGQEASEATPETASAEPTEPDPAPEQKALAFDTADVVELVGHVRTLTGLLDEKDAKMALLTAALDEKAAEIDRLTADNDEARRLIEKVMAMPLRRKAVGHVETFTTKAPDFLAPAVRRLLEHS